MPDGPDVPAHSFWARARRVGWRPFALATFVALAYQFGLHIYILSTHQPGERSDGLAVLSVAVGTPVALAWGWFAARYARRAFGSRSIPVSVLVGVATYTAAVVLAFAVYVSNHLGWDTAREWLELVPIFTVLSTLILPGSVAMCVLNPIWETISLVAFGLPTVGPMLLLIQQRSKANTS